MTDVKEGRILFYAAQAFTLGIWYLLCNCLGLDYGAHDKCLVVLHLFVSTGLAAVE